MKTQEEIVERLKEPGDMFGFGPGVLIGYLEYEHAKPYLKEGVTTEEWKPDTLTREAVLETMRDYMEFAWGKAQNHRGLSASRSVIKFEAWVWLLGDSPIEAEYAQYGCPTLAAICARYDFPVPQDKFTQAMIDGRILEE